MEVNRPQSVNNNIHISYIKEMKSDKELALIRKVTGEWDKAAKGKIEFFKKKNDLERMKIATDAQEVAEGIRSILADKASINTVMNPLYTEEKIKKGQVAVYAAYDNRGYIQGCALVDLKGNSEYPFVLDELMVNSERIKSIGKREPISGTGTKLVQTVAQKVLKSQGKKELGTISLGSSVGFYEKLGFQCDGGGGGTGVGMFLAEKQLRELALKKV